MPSTMKLDPAVLSLLNVDADSTTVSAAGGGGCSSASTSKIGTKLADGTEKLFFMKTGTGRKAEMMFEGEHESLNAIHSVVPSLCPQSHGHGHFASSPATSFLVTDFLALSGGLAAKSSAPSLAVKLAKLHTTPAPIPEGYTEPVFGFPVTTCCGDTPQDNSYKSSWAEFYADNRLRTVLRQAEEANGADAELASLVEATAAKVVPRLLGDAHLNNGAGVVPVVVHGDLWRGNAGGVPEDVVFDPSACWAHNEYELGIIKMFGGFGRILKEYHELVPKCEPVAEYEERVELYELYHHLNHYALFGGRYRAGAVGIMEKLLEKYGGD